MSCKEVETNLEQGVLHNTEWIQRWSVNQIAFHADKHQPFLDERNEEIFGGKTKSIFLPLCGKSVDMLWMYKRGHTVCGVEIAEQAIKDFLEESKIEADIETIATIGNLYKSKDGRLRLYAADVFDMSPELCGSFDVIWDSKSLVAINKGDREQYSKLLLSLMKKDGLYYLSTLDYDPTVWPGPPHTTPDDVVKELYGDTCDIEMLQEAEMTGSMPHNITTPNEGPPAPGSDEAVVAALGASSYLFFRWYKMTYKPA